MRTSTLLFSALGAALVSAGAVTAHAAQGVFYDPTNAASSSGKTVGYELYRTIGCPGRGLLDPACPVPAPVDSDGDGVTDSKDKCPNTPVGRKVDAQGCELDGDGDGIVDAQDKCAAVYAKTADGCPPPAAAEPDKLVLEGVNFDNDEAVLRLDAYAILDRVVTSLKSWGEVKVEIAGHTDSVGSDEDNIALSQRRAETVRTYLIGKGIAADRLIAKGYGEAQPVADNETAEGRFQNRRVELVPLK